jgi:hypothetical protein
MSGDSLWFSFAAYVVNSLWFSFAAYVVNSLWFSFAAYVVNSLWFSFAVRGSLVRCQGLLEVLSAAYCRGIPCGSLLMLMSGFPFVILFCG